MIKTITISDQSVRRIAAAFALFMFVYEIYVVGAAYSNYLAYLIDSETLFFTAVALFCILLSFYIFYRAVRFALSASVPYEILCFLIFFASIVVEYGYHKALGRFSDKIDIETAIASTPEQKLVSISMYLSTAVIIPGLVLLALMVLTRPEKPRGLKDLLIVMLMIIAGFAVFPSVVDQKFPTFATVCFLRTNTDFLLNGPMTSGKWASGVTGVDIRRRAVGKPRLPEGYHPSNNVVVVIDESVMGDHLSVNGYGRETSPVFDKLAQQKILNNWGIGAAASTGSRFTYSALIAGLTPDDFPDRTNFKIDTFPTVFQYAKAMGYKTYFFDGQMNGYWGGIGDDLNYIDSWQGVLEVSDHKGFETWELDNLIAAKMKTIIYGSTGNFIFVFKHGAHVPYGINFPPDQAVWQPSYQSTSKFEIPSGDRLTEVVNAYDNSIRYNLNSFFKNLIDDYTAIPNNTVIIYTGDHGQTLFANGRSSHGGDTKGEATVPLVMIGKLDAPVDTAYRASHANIFPTILDLLRYPEELRGSLRFPSLLKARAADSRPRYFNPDLGTRVPFD